MIRRLLRNFFRGIAAVIILFEEWGWEPLARLLARLGRLPVFRAVERWISGLPPAGALVMFLLPGVVLLPFKLLALYWIGAGHVMLGVGVIILAKLAGTAVLARIFSLTQPTLMKLGWFAAVYSRFKSWKDRLIAWVKESAWYQAVRAKVHAVKAAVRAWWKGKAGAGSSGSAV